MGPEAHGRLSKLLQYYNAENSDGLDRGATMRAEALARNTKAPDAVRSFYSSFSRNQQYTINSKTKFSSFLRTIASHDLFLKWTELRELATKRDPALLQFLHSQNFHSGPGRDFKALVNMYLAQSLGLRSVASLQNICQAAMGLADLVNAFGYGILILLPGSAGGR